MAAHTKHQDREITIPSVDDDECSLFFERNDHLTGELSFFTTVEFDGCETNMRISKKSAQALHDWLGQLSK